MQVVVRCRPLVSRESEAPRTDVNVCGAGLQLHRRERRHRQHTNVLLDSAHGVVSIKAGGEAAGCLPRCFSFDRVFEPRATQEEVYRLAARTAVLSVTEGFNSTVFAYGQTGSGE